MRAECSAFRYFLKGDGDLVLSVYIRVLCVFLEPVQRGSCSL
ncbi:hypothetical protein TPASS_0332 [Treponema pallidum subsp. pallidum SS14]|uniref:Uncharacterized protein TP_0332 n=2 Tax=Treponema pallidum subsp. pallidum TaxID=161 RepID=Y332_TREPA|nr:RecName: Full=Uncharacterized protein TP_0332 [Treponema pallidum subsp. pallidum str. Nichols]AAC65327.1 predicted coding region TP0332 [Treponema pallidum subsp. pallidum str. Nichols]ACD70758.1 hypothetical protein TPASS_0332 [Treponema pallidum subsp. pallidum SS14]